METTHDDAALRLTRTDPNTPPTRSAASAERTAVMRLVELPPMTPRSRHTFEFMFALVAEHDLRACQEVGDGSRDQHYVWARVCGHAWPICTAMPATSSS